MRAGVLEVLGKAGGPLAVPQILAQLPADTDADEAPDTTGTGGRPTAPEAGGTGA